MPEIFSSADVIKERRLIDNDADDVTKKTQKMLRLGNTKLFEFSLIFHSFSIQNFKRESFLFELNDALNIIAKVLYTRRISK